MNRSLLFLAPEKLSPTDIYWITLIGIALCFLAIGYICGMVRGGRLGYDDGYNEAIDEFADPDPQLHADEDFFEPSDHFITIADDDGSLLCVKAPHTVTEVRS